VPQRTPQARRVLRNAQNFGFGCASSEAQREVRISALSDVNLAVLSAESLWCSWARRREDLRFERLSIEWLGEEESLDFVDVFGAQVVQLARGLDAFGKGS
jgi:hypothetical protein